MESNKILGADILDILFEGRNKEYGAYELRKAYNKRLGRAMAAMSSVVLLLFLSGFVGKHGDKKAVVLAGPDVVIGPPPAVDPPPPPPPPPPKPQVPQVKTMIVTPPRIVPDDKVEAPPPTIDEIEKVKIGTVNTPGGADDDGITAPVGDGDKHVVEAPKKQADDDGVVLNVQIESTYPGGIEAWRRFLGKNLRYPEQAANDGVGGQILVRFVVDKDGNVSDVEVVSGPDQGGLREEAIRVIRKSGKWIPGVQNGRNVKSYKLQPVTFVPATDQ